MHTSIQPSALVTSGLAPYTGPWGQAQAAHLLRRTLFGPKRDELNGAVAAGLADTLNQLLAAPTIPAPPVNHFYTDDPNVPVGATWVDSPHVEGADVGQYRSPSVRGWYIHNLIDHDFNIMEKIAMFWVNHFGMSDVGEHRAQYQYVQLFREYGLGNFKEMIEKITVHPAMLRFLNGEYSNKWEPNENYARELLELFTIQKGEQVAPGDYTYYTEEDVREIARALTGWRNQGMWSQEDVPVASWFDANWHDGDPKTLSHRFDNAVIHRQNQAEWDQEYKDVINIIFGKTETARAICRELYRFFVYYDITESVENQVIIPLADHLIDEDFSIREALRLLFGSQHFFDMAVRGPHIKNPYEFVISMARPLGGYSHHGLSLDNPVDLDTAYKIGTAYHWHLYTMDMDFLYPPTVAGWKAYYQAPGYYRNWIGSTTLQQRRRMAQRLTGNGIYANDEPYPFDFMGFISSLTNPYEVNEMVLEITQIFLPRQLHPDQLTALKQQLIPNLPDEEWTLQFSDYEANPFNPDVVGPIYNKVRDFFRALFSMAEFHLQ
ncbi:MAG: DUF1800 family protein [Bacteroidota bacterium]